MSRKIKAQVTPLTSLVILERNPIGDERGYLERMFCRRELSEFLGERNIVQINHTLTQKKGAIRGMHFQFPPHAETKIVSCIRGAVLDIAVDIRKNSPTFLQWYSEVLSADNHKSLYIPEGFAHGFQTLTDGCELLYYHTHEYHPAAEGALNALDPELGIEWPLEITERSKRDSEHPMITSDFQGVTI